MGSARTAVVPKFPDTILLHLSFILPNHYPHPTMSFISLQPLALLEVENIPLTSNFLAFFVGSQVGIFLSYSPFLYVFTGCSNCSCLMETHVAIGVNLCLSQRQMPGASRNSGEAGR